MLKINYATDISNKEKMNAFFSAVHFESNTMMIAVNNDAIVKCNQKIANKSGKLTEIQIEAEKAKKPDLEKSNRKLKEENDKLYENWELVVSAIVGASNMKDLKIIYEDENGKCISKEYNRIMDFIDEMELDNIDIMLNYTNVLAIFFENSFNTKYFDTIEELLEHCKNIIK